MTSDAILVRNYDLIKRVFENLDVLSIQYKLAKRDINIVHYLLNRHNTYNAYIEVKISEISESRKTFYRAINKLEDKNVIVVVERPKNQFSNLLLYFTVDFIVNICGEEQGDLYERWLDWQLSYKNKKGEED